MTNFDDKEKVMLRLIQQNTEEYKESIISELENSAHSCMLAENEAQPAEFMQNILFTSGMFIHNIMQLLQHLSHSSFHIQAISLLS